MYPTKGGRIVLENARDLEFANAAVGFSRLDASYERIKAPTKYPFRLGLHDSMDVIYGGMAYLRVMHEAMAVAPVMYERDPSDMSLEDDKIVIRTPEQGRFISGFLDAVAPRGTSGNPNVHLFGNLDKRSGPYELDEELTDFISGEMVMAVRGVTGWTEEQAQSFQFEGKPVTKEVLERLLNEDLLGLGVRYGYGHHERHSWLFGKYMRSLQVASSGSYELMRRAKGWA